MPSKLAALVLNINNVFKKTKTILHVIVNVIDDNTCKIILFPRLSVISRVMYLIQSISGK